MMVLYLSVTEMCSLCGWQLFCYQPTITNSWLGALEPSQERVRFAELLSADPEVGREVDLFRGGSLFGVITR